MAEADSFLSGQGIKKSSGTFF